MPASITLAKQSSTGNIQHIGEADKTKPDLFTCVGCGKEMIAVKSVARKRDWHFRHKVESDCTGGRDKALHDYAVQILMENSGIVISRSLKAIYSNPRKEVAIFNKRSDVTVLVENEDVHFEIFVTHDLGQEKIDLYKSNKIKCVRINLSNAYWLTASPDGIQKAVLFDTETRNVIFWDDEILTKEENNKWLTAVSVGAITILSFLLLRWLFKKRRRYF